MSHPIYPPSTASTDPLRAAFQAFQEQRLPEARKLLEDILVREPEHAVALNLLGIVFHGLGQREEALACVQRAVNTRNPSPDHCNNLGILLHEVGRFTEAIAALQKAITLAPAYPDAYYNLGNSFQALRRFDEAIAAYHKAIELKPDFPAAYNNLGGALREQGRLSEAVACCRTILRLTPNDPKMHLNLGSLLRDLEKFDEAIASYRRALELQPDYLDAHQNLGTLLRSQNRHAEAAQCFQAILRLQPNHPSAQMDLGAVLQAQGRFKEAGDFYQQALRSASDSAPSWSALGTTLQEQGRLEEAVECYRKAIAVDAHFPGAHNNLGLVLSLQDRLDEAVLCFRQALEHQPDFYEAWNNLGNTYVDLGQFDPAMHAYTRANIIRPDYPDGHWNKSLLLLLRGDLTAGFAEYEWRWLRFRECRRHLRQPLWDGSDLCGRTIVIHAEQGFGDTIQFARYIPLVAKMNGRVLVECQAELHALMQSLVGPQRVYAQAEHLPDFQLQIPMMTLPAAMGTTLETIPQNVPYLTPDPARVAHWQQRILAQAPTQATSSPRPLRVGLSWAGRKTHHKDRHRSCPLELFAPLAALPNVQFYSLQKWQPATPRPGFLPAHRLHP